MRNKIAAYSGARALGEIVNKRRREGLVTIERQTHLQLFTSVNEVFRDPGYSVVAQVQAAEEGEVLELVRAEDRVEVVPEHVVTEVDLLQGVLHPVEESLRQAPHGVVGEVDHLEGDIASREYLSGEELPAHILLTELLDVITEWEDGEVSSEYDVVTVDPGGVDVIERTLTGDVDGGAELHTGNLYRLGCCLCRVGQTGGQQYRQASPQTPAGGPGGLLSSTSFCWRT